MTLKNSLNRNTDEAKEVICQVGLAAADNKRQIAVKQKLSEVWAEKAKKLQQVGQDALHLDLGVMFEVYCQTHKWGVCKIVG